MKNKTNKTLGNYERRKCIFFGLLIVIKLWPVLVFMFIYRQPHFECSDVRNETISSANVSEDECSVEYGDDEEVQCQHFQFITNVSTATEEFKLVCNRSYMRPLSLSLCLLIKGVFLLTFGVITDKFGRRKTFLFLLAGYLPLSFAVYFASNFIFFTAIMMMLNGLSVMQYTIIFISSMELVSEKHRNAMGLYIYLCYCVGQCMLSIPAYIFEANWRNLVLFLSFLNLLFLASIWLYPPSLHWLICKRKFKEAKKLIKVIAKTNGEEYDDEEVTSSIMKQAKEEEEREAKKVSSFGGFLELMKNKVMLARVCVMCYLWFITSFIFYGITLNMQALNGNIYINNVINGALQIPAVVIAWAAIDRFGRVWTTSAFFMLSGLLCCMVPVFINMSSVILTSFALVGNACISGAFSAIYIVTPELSPTYTRAQIMTVCSSMARLGSFISPFVMFLGEVFTKSTPFIIFGILGIVASLLTLLVIPETANVQIPETLKDSLKQKTVLLRKKKNLIDDVEILEEHGT